MVTCPPHRAHVLDKETKEERCSKKCKTDYKTNKDGDCVKSATAAEKKKASAARKRESEKKRKEKETERKRKMKETEKKRREREKLKKMNEKKRETERKQKEKEKLTERKRKEKETEKRKKEKEKELAQKKKEKESLKKQKQKETEKKRKETEKKKKETEKRKKASAAKKKSSENKKKSAPKKKVVVNQNGRMTLLDLNELNDIVIGSGPATPVATPSTAPSIVIPVTNEANWTGSETLSVEDAKKATEGYTERSNNIQALFGNKAFVFTPALAEKMKAKKVVKFTVVKGRSWQSENLMTRNSAIVTWQNWDSTNKSGADEDENPVLCDLKDGRYVYPKNSTDPIYVLLK